LEKATKYDIILVRKKALIYAYNMVRRFYGSPERTHYEWRKKTCVIRSI